MNCQPLFLGLFSLFYSVKRILTVQCFVCATLGVKNVRYTSRDVGGIWRTLPVDAPNQVGAVDPIFGLPGNVKTYNFGGDSDCAEKPFNKSRYMNQNKVSLCELQHKWCAKAVDRSGNTARFCMAENRQTNVGCASSGNITLCVCKTELCNDSPRPSYNSVLLMLFFLTFPFAT